jgi:hypothetical protein
LIEEVVLVQEAQGRLLATTLAKDQVVEDGYVHRR